MAQYQINFIIICGQFITMIVLIIFRNRIEKWLEKNGKNE